MKNVKALLATLLLAGSTIATGTSWAADGVIAKDVLNPGSYCHMKFPAIDPSTLDSARPTLESSASSGDAIDFYGPCDEKPTGQDQVQAQKLDRERHEFDD